MVEETPRVDPPPEAVMAEALVDVIVTNLLMEVAV